jgi:hypothetical protein
MLSPLFGDREKKGLMIIDNLTRSKKKKKEKEKVKVKVIILIHRSGVGDS